MNRKRKGNDKKGQFSLLNQKKKIVYDVDGEQQHSSTYRHTKQQQRSSLKKDRLIHFARQFIKNGGEMQNLVKQLVGDEERKCAICQVDDFSQGRFIFQCGHNICNECFKYWHEVKRQCPCCNTKIQEVLCLFNDSFRQKKLTNLSLITACQKCKQNCNYNQMYFCDACNHNSIHIYCHPSLSKHQTHWICQQCTRQDNVIPFYSESFSPHQENQYIEDSFVVFDDDYIDEMELYSEGMRGDEDMMYWDQAEQKQKEKEKEVKKGRHAGQGGKGKKKR